jgi:hypothetical protein
MPELKMEFNNKEEEDIDLLQYQLDEINQELSWQHQIDRIDELKKKKEELIEKIKKNNK